VRRCGIALEALQMPEYQRVDKILKIRAAFDSSNRRVGNRNCAVGSRRKKLQAIDPPEPPVPPRLVHEQPEPLRAPAPQAMHSHLRVVQVKRSAKRRQSA
jgi:hypothetical protein